MSTILFIDDDPMFLSLGASILGHEGFLCFSAQTGKKGLELALHKSPDLVLLDLLMPDVDGLQVCHHLRQKRRCLPILLLTVLDADQYIQQGFEAGATDYIMKPIHWEELLARIRFHLTITRPCLEGIVALEYQRSLTQYWQARYNKLSEYVLYWLEILGKEYWEETEPFHAAVDHFKNMLIRQAFFAHDGKVKSAAGALKISTRSFRRRLKHIKQTSLAPSAKKSGISVHSRQKVSS